MLDAFIIEEIQRRERLDDRVQPMLERPGRYPVPPEAPEDVRRPDDDEESDRGVVIFDM